MQSEEILKALEYDDGIFPREALAAAIENQTEIIPGLIGFIRHARENAETLRKPEGKRYMGHIYAMFLLAQFREQSAYAPIVDFFGSLPEETLDDLTGDMVTEALHRVLASVSCGDDTLIRGLLENESAFSWVRAAAVQALGILVATGHKSRHEVIDYFAHLFKSGLRREPSVVWDELVACTTDLNPGELYDEILKADEEKLFAKGYISLREVEDEKNRTVDASLAANVADNKDYSLISNAIEDVEMLASFMHEQNEPDDFEDDEIEDLYDDEFFPEIDRISGEPKIGRNEPCPCGSGKKYKKCCGG